MQRRLALTLCALAPAAWLGGCSPGARSHRISLAQLQEALGRRFPRQQQLAGGWNLLLQAPQLGLLPARNRLSALCPLLLSGPLLREPRSGQLGLEFGLRYTAEDHCLRATGLQLQELRIDGLPSRASALLQGLLGQWAEQQWSELPLYQLSATEQERLQRLGLQPGAITVTEQGLEVAL